MNPKLYLIAALVATVLVRGGSWLCGYFASLAPFSMLTPIIFLSLALIPLIVALIGLVQLFSKKRSLNQRVVIAGAAMAILVLPFLLPIPSNLDAFAQRMNNHSQEEWFAFVESAKELANNKDLKTEKTINLNDRWNYTLVRELESDYEFLKLGDWEPKLVFSSEKTTLFWGSGLIGALGVEIWSSESEPKYQNYGRVIQLYQRVYVVSF